MARSVRTDTVGGPWLPATGRTAPWRPGARPDAAGRKHAAPSCARLRPMRGTVAGLRAQGVGQKPLVAGSGSEPPSRPIRGDGSRSAPARNPPAPCPPCLASASLCLIVPMELAETTEEGRLQRKCFPPRLAFALPFRLAPFPPRLAFASL